MRLGVLDVGSNTVHLLVVDAHHGAAPLPAHSHKVEMRLAEHIVDGERISDAGVDILVTFILGAQQVAEDFGVTETIAFATSAIREAANGDEVLREVRERTGIDLAVLSGDDEARLTFLAVRRWFGWSSGRLLVLDIGGGSLEVAVGSDEVPDVAVSLPLGAGRLTREFISTSRRCASTPGPPSRGSPRPSPAPVIRATLWRPARPSAPWLASQERRRRVRAHSYAGDSSVRTSDSGCPGSRR